jgi:large subunit ribosomal protein L25
MIFKINAESRNTVKKSDLSKLRNDGFIPAVIYGQGVEPLSITLNKSDFMKIYKKTIGEVVFFEVMAAGKEYHTLIKERQIHPVSREILHVDFMVVPPNHMIDVEVPLKFVGTPIGAKTGGFIDVVHRTLKIQCMEANLPEDIEVDITSLAVGEALHAHQLPKGNWIVKEHPDSVLITIHAKKIDTPSTDVKVETKEEETSDK